MRSLERRLTNASELTKVVSAPPDTPGNGSLVVEAGWPVASDAEPVSPVEVRTLNATRALRHVHVGPYEELDAGFYAQLFTVAHDQGLTLASAPRERYLNDPTSGEEPLTEIVWPIS